MRITDILPLLTGIAVGVALNWGIKASAIGLLVAYSGQPWRLWCGDGSIDNGSEHHTIEKYSERYRDPHRRSDSTVQRQL